MVAVYLMSNNTARAFVFEAKHVKTDLHGHLLETVVCEGCYLFNSIEGEQAVDPNGSKQVRFPIPDGSTSWQCGVSLLDVKRMKAILRRPAWEWRCIELFNRAGIKFESAHWIWSSMERVN